MLENTLADAGLILVGGFSSGYIGIVGAKTCYDFFRRGERSLDRFLTKTMEQMFNHNTMKATVYVGGAITFGYLVLNNVLMK